MKVQKALGMVVSMAVIGTLVAIGAGAAADYANGPWADSATAAQGLRKDGTAVRPQRSNPSNAVGPAELTGVEPTFYSLGFGGTITLKFDNFIGNGPGDDIEVWEITNGAYPLEKAKVEVSQDGTTFYLAGYADNTQSPTTPGHKSTVPLPTGMSWAQYVRLTDVTNPAAFTGSYDANTMPDGFDLDGVKAIYLYIPVNIDIKPGSYPNSINRGNGGNVPVAVFSTPDFDATTIVLESVVFAGAAALPIGQSPQDINGDGLLDMVFHFTTRDLDLTTDSVVAWLTGELPGGAPFKGFDTVRVIK